ncbi:MAG: hypothetical protein HEQ38_02505 [Gemmatimonas sp.]|nr:hypothetical protein [Gemmatimonas sp.]
MICECTGTERDVGICSAIGAGGWWSGRATAPEAARWARFTQLTDASGVETSPAIAPDGESFAYASDARGSMDIYVQRGATTAYG